MYSLTDDREDYTCPVCNGYIDFCVAYNEETDTRYRLPWEEFYELPTEDEACETDAKVYQLYSHCPQCEGTGIVSPNEEIQPFGIL